MERKFSQSDKLLNHELGSIISKILSLTCLACAVVASWYLTQDVLGLNPFTSVTNIFSHYIQ